MTCVDGSRPVIELTDEEVGHAVRAMQRQQSYTFEKLLEVAVDAINIYRRAGL